MGPKNSSETEKLNQGTLLVALYWLVQMLAILFPGTAFRDPDGLTMPTVLSVETNQLLLSLVVILPLLALGYFTERKRLTNQSIR